MFGGVVWSFWGEFGLFLFWGLSVLVGLGVYGGQRYTWLSGVNEAAGDGKGLSSVVRSGWGGGNGSVIWFLQVRDDCMYLFFVFVSHFGCVAVGLFGCRYRIRT